MEMDHDPEEEGLPKSLQQLCRLCLGDESLEDIFKQEDLHEWISDFLSILVCVDDKLSKAICFCCRTRLTEFRSFQQQCLEVQDVLQGELTAILNDKAMELIVTDHENDQTREGSVPVDWEEIPATHHGEVDQSQEVNLPVEWEEVPETHQGELQIVESEKDLDEARSAFEDVSMVEAPELAIPAHLEQDVTKETDVEIVDNVPEGGSESDTRTSIESVANRGPISNEHPFQCEICHKVWETRKQLSNHRAVHIRKYACTICAKTFPRPVRLKNHMEIHHSKEKSVDLTETGENFQVSIVDHVSQEGLDFQIKFVESMADATEVPSETIKVEELIIEDQEMGHEVVPETTAIPNEHVVKAVESFSNVTPANIEDNGYLLGCDQCDKKFQTRRQYRGHKWFVHGPKDHICNGCGKGYVSQARLAVHYRRTNACRPGGTPKTVAPPVIETIEIPDDDDDDNPQDPSSEIVHVDPPEDQPNQCTVCRKVFKNSERLHVHRRMVHGPRKYACPVCSRSFAAREYMMKHMMTHTEANFYKPSEEIFDSPVHGPRSHACSTCKISFVLYRDLEAHKLTHEHLIAEATKNPEESQSRIVTITEGNTSYRRFECTQCLMVFSCSSRLFEHRKRSHMERKHACPVCGKPLVTRQELFMHLNSHTVKKPVKMVRVKDKVKLNLQNVDEEQMTECQNEDGSFVCGFCHAVLQTKELLFIHRKQVHGVKNYICPYGLCKKKFMTRGKLLIHMPIHYPTGLRKHHCHLCISRFPTKAKLEQHLTLHLRKQKLRDKLLTKKVETHEVKTETNEAVVVTVMDVVDSLVEHQLNKDNVQNIVHANSERADNSQIRKPAVSEVRYGTVKDSEGRVKKGCEAIKTKNCSVCKEDIQASHFEGHMNRHKGIRPFKCEKGCSGLFFYCPMLLSYHYDRTHGNTPTECDICHKVYTSRLRMRSHQREVHAKIHVCMNCPQVFDSSESLKRHIETANHVKRYPCPKCSASFDRQHQLSKHEKMHVETKRATRTRHVETKRVTRSRKVVLKDSIEIEPVKVETRESDDEGSSSRS